MENKPKRNTINKIKKLTKIQEFLKLNLLLLLLFFLSLSLSLSQLSPKALEDSTRKISTQPTKKYFNLSIKQDQKCQQNSHWLITSMCQPTNENKPLKSNLKVN